MIAQSAYKAVLYNGQPVADDLVSCCRNCSLELARLQFPAWPNVMKDVWMGFNLLEGLQVTS
jgi:hypothetical protein